jgi:hypothetical protein
MSAWSRAVPVILTFALYACTGENEADGLVYAMKSGSFYGSITSSPAGILVQDGGAHQAEAFDAGATVTLTASGSANSTFLGWTGEGCSGTSTCKVVSKGPGFYQYVLATFRSTTPAAPFGLSLANPPREALPDGERPPSHGDGTVTVEIPDAEPVICTTNDGRLLCDGQPSISFNTPTTVRLTATPATGSVFTGWLAFGCGVNPVCEVEVGDTDVLAQVFFERS